MGKMIALLGTGANGTYVSADLIRSGHDVTTIDQQAAPVETMRAGLSINR